MKKTALILELACFWNVLFFCISVLPSWSNSLTHIDFNENCKRAFLYSARLQYDKAASIIQAEKVANPQNIIPVYLDAYNAFIQALKSDAMTDYLRSVEKSKNCIDVFKKNTAQNSWVLCCQAEAHLMIGILQAKQGNYTTTGIEMNKAYRLYTANQKNFPGFIHDLRGLSLLHLAIGSIPDEYQWVVQIAGFQGTISQGRLEVSQVLLASVQQKEWSFLKEEAAVLLAFTEMQFAQGKPDWDKAIQILDAPGYKGLEKLNALFCFAKTQLLIKLGSSEKALSLFVQNIAPSQMVNFPFLYFVRGELLLNRLDTSAKYDFRQFINTTKGDNYIKSAWQKLAWIALIENKPLQYQQAMQQVMKVGQNLNDEDNQALREAQKNAIPDCELLKARLLYDGGYYYKALDELKKKSSFTSLAEQVENLYRHGRIYHALEQYELAEKFYLQTIAKGERQPWYFACRSALELGHIYEEKKNYLQARKYYQQALSMKPDEYRKGLHQKAKAGLNRITGL